MKIIYYYEDLDDQMHKWQHSHIIDELRCHNCEIEIFDFSKYFSFDEANNKLIEKIINTNYDLFMTCYSQKELYIKTLKKIKSLGIPTLLICFDNLTIPYVHKKIAPYFDLVWLTSKETKWYFDKLKCKTVFMPYAANPNMEVLENNSQINAIGFLGTPYGSRAVDINNLTNNGIDAYATTNFNTSGNDYKSNIFIEIKTLYNCLFFKEGRKIIVGAILKRLKNEDRIVVNNHLFNAEPVKPEEIYKGYAKYSLVLSPMTYGSTGYLKKPLYSVNLRNFETPMSGSVMFCPYFEELNSYFEDGKEAIYYKNEEDMIRKAKYYLDPNNKDKLEKIRKAARAKAIKEHTWFCRFKKIFEILKLTDYID